MTNNVQLEKLAQLKWTGFILAFFMIQAIVWAVAFSVTLGDRSHAVVSGYDEKALHWDEEKARRQASDRLGWKTEILIDATSDVRGYRDITIQIRDVNEIPLSDATIQLNAFHRARAAECQQIVFFEIDKGIYIGTIQIRKTGLWQFEGEATLDGQIRLIEQQIHVVKGN